MAKQGALTTRDQGHCLQGEDWAPPPKLTGGRTQPGGAEGKDAQTQPTYGHRAQRVW